MTHPVRAWIALTAAACAAPGCYSYSAATLEQLEPGTEVRARVSAEESGRLAQYVPVNGRVVEGRFLGRTTDGTGILLEVPVVHNVRADRIRTLNQRIDIAAPAIVELDVKELDRLRTFLLAGAGVAVVAVAVLPRLTSGGSGGPGDGQPPPEDPFIVRFRIPVGQ